MVSQSVRDAFLRSVEGPVSVEKLALVSVGALDPVGTGRLNLTALHLLHFQKVCQAGTVLSQRIVRRHEPGKLRWSIYFFFVPAWSSSIIV